MKLWTWLALAVLLLCTVVPLAAQDDEEGEPVEVTEEADVQSETEAIGDDPTPEPTATPTATVTVTPTEVPTATLIPTSTVSEASLWLTQTAVVAAMYPTRFAVQTASVAQAPTLTPAPVMVHYSCTTVELSVRPSIPAGSDESFRAGGFRPGTFASVSIREDPDSFMVPSLVMVDEACNASGMIRTLRSDRLGIYTLTVRGESYLGGPTQASAVFALVRR